MRNKKKNYFQIIEPLKMYLYFFLPMIFYCCRGLIITNPKDQFYLEGYDLIKS